MGIIGTLTAAASSMSKVMACRNMEDRLGERERERQRLVTCALTYTT